MPAGRHSGPLVAAVLAVALGGCRAKVEVATLPDESPSLRAANSFVHCIEGANSACVEPGQASRGWHGFALLAWLSHGSPVAIASSLPHQLAIHAEPRLIERRMVDEVERYAIALRGAGCSGVEEHSLGPLVERAATSAAERLDGLALWVRGASDAIGMLREDARAELAQGTLVAMRCPTDPYLLYVGTRYSEGRYSVVGMSTLVPAALGGERLDPERVAVRLESRALGLQGASSPLPDDAIGPWLPFPVEEF